MALILVLLFLVLPIAEIYVIIQVGQAIGIFPTLALLIIDGFVGAFTAAGTKTQDPSEGPPGPGKASNLRAGWRTAVPAGLDELVVAWRADDAYEGTISAGGITMPADAVAVVAIEELVVHGWDLAKALGEEVILDPELCEYCLEFWFPMAATLPSSGFYKDARMPPEGADVATRLLSFLGREV